MATGLSILFRATDWSEVKPSELSDLIMRAVISSEDGSTDAEDVINGLVRAYTAALALQVRHREESGHPIPPYDIVTGDAAEAVYQRAYAAQWKAETGRAEVPEGYGWWRDCMPLAANWPVVLLTLLGQYSAVKDAIADRAMARAMKELDRENRL